MMEFSLWVYLPMIFSAFSPRQTFSFPFALTRRILGFSFTARHPDHSHCGGSKRCDMILLDAYQPHPPHKKPKNIGNSLLQGQDIQENKPYFLSDNASVDNSTDEVAPPNRNLGDSVIKEVVSPLFSRDVQKGVLGNVIKGAAITGLGIAAFAGQDILICGAVSLGAMYVAVTPGPVGDVVRLLGALTWNSTQDAWRLYKAYESKQERNLMKETIRDKRFNNAENVEEHMMGHNESHPPVIPMGDETVLLDHDGSIDRNSAITSDHSPEIQIEPLLQDNVHDVVSTIDNNMDSSVRSGRRDSNNDAARDKDVLDDSNLLMSENNKISTEVTHLDVIVISSSVPEGNVTKALSVLTNLNVDTSQKKRVKSKKIVVSKSKSKRRLMDDSQLNTAPNQENGEKAKWDAARNLALSLISPNQHEVSSKDMIPSPTNHTLSITQTASRKSTRSKMKLEQYQDDFDTPSKESATGIRAPIFEASSKDLKSKIKTVPLKKSNESSPMESLFRTTNQHDRNYEQMTVIELKQELRSLGLKVSGVKSELISRLRGGK